ncbi:MAG: hypothetical protein O6649_01435 [Gammaproteobacteria bacterium]|nr:hypothetical protein [Gammaproteobacteria bacterium]
MKNPISLLAFIFPVVGSLSQTLVAGSQDGTEPYIVKDKIELALNTDEIRKQSLVLGYRNCEIEYRDKGWRKGEHTHPKYYLFFGKMGKMEFIIKGQRFVLEPGDELYYPRSALMAAKNLHDGRSEWFICIKDN